MQWQSRIPIASWLTGATPSICSATHWPTPRRRKTPQMAWDAAIGLSDAFFAHLMEHWVPLSKDGIVWLKHSSLALDLYVWLTYRLHTLRRETTVPWHVLAHHLGSESGHRQLAFRLEEVLKDVAAVYPEARVEASSFVAWILRPSQPSIPATGVVVEAAVGTE